MAPTTESKEDEMLKYLLLVMKHADFKPDYHQIAKEAGLSNANTAQKRFKKFVEIGGFRLVGGAVVEPGESGGAPTTPVKAKAQAKQSAKTPTPNKKRKMNETTPSEEKESEEDVKLEVRSEQEKYRKKNTFSKVGNTSNGIQAKPLSAVTKGECFKLNQKAPASDFGVNDGHNVFKLGTLVLVFSSFIYVIPQSFTRFLVSHDKATQYYVRACASLIHRSFLYELHSKMPPKTAPSQEETVNYLLCVIKSCVDFQPNFTQVAGEFGINTSRPSIDAQRRFKSIVEKAGFKLENGKQVTGGGTLTENPTVAASANAMGSGGDTSQTPKKSRKKIETESSAKRRKINKGKTLEPDAEGDHEDAVNGQKVS